MLTRPKPGGLAVETTLEHFSILSFHVDPAALGRHLHPRYEPDVVHLEDYGPRALLSVVTFLDRDFRLVRCPWPRFHFGQTNYRAYVTDRETGEHVAWFFGTSLDSLSVHVPRLLWGLPWHRARIDFDCQLGAQGERYSRYRVATESRWAPAQLELEDLGRAPEELEGFPDLESAHVLLTHPTRGVFYRLDGRLGTYSIWHDRIRPTVARAERASFPLLDRLGLVAEGNLDAIHSVMLQPSIGFTIYLPPRVVRE